jgi:hypothetical protein
LDKKIIKVIEDDYLLIIVVNTSTLNTSILIQNIFKVTTPSFKARCGPPIHRILPTETWKVISEAFKRILYACYQLLTNFRFTSPINDALEETPGKEI